MMELLIAVALIAVVLGLYIGFDKMAKKELNERVSKASQKSLEAAYLPEAEEQLEYYLADTVFLLDPLALLSWEMQ